MKKVLIMSQNFYPEIGSAGNRMKNIFKFLGDSGYEVDILTTEPTYPTKKIYEDVEFWDEQSLNEKTNNVKRIKISDRNHSKTFFSRLIFYLEMYLKFIVEVLINREKYDVVFVTSPPIFVAMVGVLAKWRFKARLILDIRDLWPESLKGVRVFDYKIVHFIFGRVELWIYRMSNEIIINSLGFKDHMILKRGVSPNKIHFMPNSAREEEITRKSRKTDKFKVIYAGNIGMAQNGLLLIDIAERLEKENVGFTIIGYGVNRQKVYDEIKKRNLTNVEFVSPTTRKHCLDIISDHQAGIVTLNEEPVFETVLPGKIIDYMTCGVPIVASVAGFSKQLIDNENVGFALESNRVDELIGKILLLKRNEKLWEEFSRNGNKYVENNFSWEDNINVLVNRIQEIV